MRIKPFKGILFNPNLVKLSDVITPPYDKISKEKRELYAQESPYNMVHLILPKSHTEAKNLLQEWLKKDVLQEDSAPAIYIYEQEYEYPEGVTRTRRGFVTLLEVKPFGRDSVMPHEQTFSKIKQERMELLKTCRMNFGHIFLLYTDPERKIDKLFLEGRKEKPAVEFKDETGIVHRLWRVTDTELIRWVQDSIQENLLFVADGHHRYSSAVMYKEQEKEKLGQMYTGREGFNYRMVTIVNVNSSDLTILPTHRVLKEVPGLNPQWLIGELEKYFIVEKVNIPATELLGSWLDSIRNSQTPNTLGIYMGGYDYYTLKLKSSVSLEDILGVSRPREWLYLDVNVLHLLILKNVMEIDTHNAEEEGNILYLRDAYEAVDWVKNKGASISFIINPTRIEEVQRIVELGDVMPHKSTDFYPKLHTGLVMRRVE